MIKATYEEYCDTVTGLYFDLPVYSLEGYRTMDDFYYENRIEIYNLIFSAIEFGILSKVKQVPCIILGENVMTITEDLYMEKLDDCLRCYECDEMYEQCAQVVKLKQAYENSRN
jgi:hypothetical protein